MYGLIDLGLTKATEEQPRFLSHALNTRKGVALLLRAAGAGHGEAWCGALSATDQGTPRGAASAPPATPSVAADLGESTGRWK